MPQTRPKISGCCVCERERKKKHAYLHILTQQGVRICRERGGEEGKCFFDISRMARGFMVTLSILFLQLQLSAPFSDVRINFPPSDGRNVTPVFVARIRYDTCLPLYLPFFSLSLFLSSSISLDELPIAIARLPPTNLVFILFASFTGSRSSRFRSIAVSTAM